jgi:hypothetical protein
MCCKLGSQGDSIGGGKLLTDGAHFGGCNSVVENLPSMARPKVQSPAPQKKKKKKEV